MASSSEPAVEKAPASISTRRLYYGSCHCGATRYAAFITLPPAVLEVNAKAAETIRIYKCSCSTCLKMSFFHLRLQDASHDFFLLAPLSPETEMSDYMCFEKKCHWYFCKTCGVRCFAFQNEGEVVEEVIPGLKQEKGAEEGTKTKFWTPKREGWKEQGGGCYFSLNANTLEQDQEGLSWKEWTEKKWILYLDGRFWSDNEGFEEPLEGGMY